VLAAAVEALLSGGVAVCVAAAAGLVVVVSPLLALMRDQLERLPQGLPGAMLQGSMSRQEVEQVRVQEQTGAQGAQLPDCMYKGCMCRSTSVHKRTGCIRTVVAALLTQVHVEGSAH
jgi:superfamily II DNA helicase RecQ